MEKTNMEQIMIICLVVKNLLLWGIFMIALIC